MARSIDQAYKLQEITKYNGSLMESQTSLTVTLGQNQRTNVDSALGKYRII